MSLNSEDEIIKACDEFGTDPSELTDHVAKTKPVNCVESELSKQEGIYTTLEKMKGSQEKFPQLNNVEDVPNVSEEIDESVDLTSDITEANEDEASSQASTSSTTPARLSLEEARTLLDQQYEQRSNNIKENLQRSLAVFAGIKKVNDYKKSYEAQCPPFIPNNQSSDFLTMDEQINEQTNKDDQKEPEADTPQAANIHQQSRLPSICQLCETDVTTVFQPLIVDDVKKCICQKCHVALLNKESQHDNESLIAQIVEKNNLDQANLRRDYFDIIRNPAKMEQFREEQEYKMRLPSNLQQPIVQKATLNSNNSNFYSPNEQIMQNSTQSKRKLEPKQVLPANKFPPQAGAPAMKEQKTQSIDLSTGKQREQHKTYIPAETNHTQNVSVIQSQPHINSTPNSVQNELQVMQNIYAQQIPQANMQNNPVLMQMIQNMMVQSTPESLNATSLSLNDNSPLLSSFQTNQPVNSAATSSSTVDPIPSSSSSMNQPGPSTSGSIDPPPPAGTQ